MGGRGRWWRRLEREGWGRGDGVWCGGGLCGRAHAVRAVRAVRACGLEGERRRLERLFACTHLFEWCILVVWLGRKTKTRKWKERKFEAHTNDIYQMVSLLAPSLTCALT